MRESGFRGALVCCSDYRCSRYVTAGADPWPDHIRLSDLEPRFIGTACGGSGDGGMRSVDKEDRALHGRVA